MRTVTLLRWCRIRAREGAVQALQGEDRNGGSAGGQRPQSPWPAATCRRQVRAKSTRQIADKVFDHLTASQEAGASDQHGTSLAAMGRFHWDNKESPVVILVQQPTATRVAEFHTQRSHGRTVKKGERGMVTLGEMRYAGTPTPTHSHDYQFNRKSHRDCEPHRGPIRSSAG